MRVRVCMCVCVDAKHHHAISGEAHARPLACLEQAGLGPCRVPCHLPKAVHPFLPSSADCGATHCELFGQLPRNLGQPEQFTANHFYGGQLYNASILAVLNVVAPAPKADYAGGSSMGWYDPDGLWSSGASLGRVYRYRPNEDWLWSAVQMRADPVLADGVCTTK